MVKRNVLFKPLRIYLGLVLFISRGIGISILLWWSLLIIIVFIHPFPWLPMKACIAEDVGSLFDCLKWVRLCFFVPILFKDFGEISYHKELVANSL